MEEHSLLIGVVGPCAAGKTTLVDGLNRLGIKCRHIAQEHSYVPAMWKKITNPDVLVYLDVSYPLTITRRKLNWTQAEYQEQLHRLRDARAKADLFIQTDRLSPDEVLQAVLKFIS
jgi:deoxyadenosine/deoxycytidine kinase